MGRSPHPLAINVCTCMYVCTCHDCWIIRVRPFFRHQYLLCAKYILPQLLSVRSRESLALPHLIKVTNTDNTHHIFYYQMALACIPSSVLYSQVQYRVHK